MLGSAIARIHAIRLAAMVRARDLVRTLLRSSQIVKHRLSCQHPENFGCMLLAASSLQNISFCRPLPLLVCESEHYSLTSLGVPKVQFESYLSGDYSRYFVIDLHCRSSVYIRHGELTPTCRLR